MPTSVGHKLNNSASCTPQIMENIAGTHRHGVSINLSNGLAKYFRQKMNPTIVEATTGTDISQVFELSTIAGNPLVLPINTWNDPAPDDHFALAIGVDDQDRIWIAGNAHENNGTSNHDSTLRMTRCLVAGGSTNPADWQTVLITHTGTGGTANLTKIAACGSAKGFTYNHFRKLSNGTLLWFMSQRDEAGFSRGRDFLAFYLNPGTVTWEPLITTTVATDQLSTGAAAPATQGHFAVARGGPSATAVTKFTNPANRVYINGVRVQKLSPIVDRLHVFGLWRTADADGNYSQQPYYVYCDNPVGNSAGWKTITGVTQPMPITWTNRVASATMIGPGTVQRSASFSITIDDAGYPHMILQNGGTAQVDADTTLAGYAGSFSGTSEAVMHVYWNGTAWVKEAIPWRGHNATTGPNSAWKSGVLFLFPAIGNRLNLVPNWGRDGTTFATKLAAVRSGSEVNFDPVSMTKRGECAFLAPNGDTPVVQSIFGAAEVVTNYAANNTNPGP